MKTFLIFLPILFSLSTYSQNPFPDTEIFLVDIIRTPNGLSFGKPLNITHRSGYDNQPCFTQDGSKILYSSVREDGQADIYQYDIQTKKESRITSTTESEFSPTLIPGENNFSVVRVEKDSAQRLWKFPMSGGEPALLFPNIDSIGYHCWIGKNSVALFILTDPPSLQIASGNDAPRKIAEKIGRCIKNVPKKNAFSFVEKEDSLLWVIKMYDIAKVKFDFVAQTPAGSEDYAWMSDGSLLIGQFGKLMRRKTGKEIKWTEVADFSDVIEKVGRITISPSGTKMAIVGVAKK